MKIKQKNDIMLVMIKRLEVSSVIMFNPLKCIIYSINLQSENAKNIYKMFLRENIETSQKINQFLCSTKSDEVASFKTTIVEFLNG